MDANACIWHHLVAATCDLLLLLLRVFLHAGHVPQVVIGCGDPNPLVAAAGIATLQSAGIQVALVGGAEEQQCYDINQEFMERMKQQAAGSS
jgi:diaminohydroxyphosphoribosylaminopyrimidine deaminase/5-amino-6-(5-phosphoribosylamino)uracil reductase